MKRKPCAPSVAFSAGPAGRRWRAGAVHRAARLILIAVPLLAACSKPTNTGDAVAGGPTEPSVAVETAPLRYGTIERALTVYGMVIPASDQIKSISVPFESVIEQSWVNVGQEVSAGDLLLTLAPSPDTRLRLQQARIELNAALEQRALMQERVRLKLSTKQELVAAESRVDQAREQVQNLSRRGADKSHAIRAATAGIVYLINVSQGQIVAAGMTLLQTVDQNQLMVRFGVEPEDIGSVRERQRVWLRSVHDPEAAPVEGYIDLVTHQVDLQTRLVTVLVRPEASGGLLLNDYIEGRIVVASKKALLAPRAALLPAGSVWHLYTLAGGHAVQHEVHKGLETATEAEVIGGGLAAGEAVVTVGHYELDNGSAVRLEPPR